MPVRDQYHDAVCHALIQDGWTITDDPLHLRWGTKDLYVDFGAERLLAARKGTQQIAVEVKSFVGLSQMKDLEQAVGQYVVYHDVMAQLEPQRQLYLAVDKDTYADLFAEPIGRLLLENSRVRLLVFDPLTEVICQWLPLTLGET
jgi:hypothetical protein